MIVRRGGCLRCQGQRNEGRAAVDSAFEVDLRLGTIDLANDIKQFCCARLVDYIRMSVAEVKEQASNAYYCIMVYHVIPTPAWQRTERFRRLT